MSECKCDLRTKLVGDGCRYCNPQEYIDKLIEIIDEQLVIYVVRKHKRSSMKWSAYRDVYHTAFEIHSAYYERQDAKAVVTDKNLRSKDYIYTLGKVEVK